MTNENTSKTEDGYPSEISTSVPSKNGSKYLQQLCKHWGHNLEVEFTSEQGHVIFPKEGRSGSWPSPARFSMTAQAEMLLCKIEGSSHEHVTSLERVIERHLDRFAFREAPLSFDWQ